MAARVRRTPVRASLTGWRLLQSMAGPVTWLSLDQSDNHPASFWTYLIAALQTAEPHIGASAISLLQSPQPPPIENWYEPKGVFHLQRRKRRIS